MSSDRSGNATTRPPLKPAVAAASRSARVPLTPRIAGTASTRPPAPATTRPIVRAPPSRATPPLKQDDRSANATLSTANITPRSAARSSRGDLAPHSGGIANDTTQARPKSTNAAVYASPTASTLDAGKSLTGTGLRPKSMNETTSRSAVGQAAGMAGSADSTDTGRFFLASDAHKQEPAPKRPEPKKSPAFFYADGKQEQTKLVPQMTTSPALSALSENHFAGSWTRTEGTHPKSPSVLSPAMSTLSNGSPYFSPAPSGLYRSPSPSKENIHLSYRKGVSQIFGTRPFVKSPTAEMHGTIAEEVASPKTSPAHRKSASISSLDSGSSPMSRRRSGTTADGLSSPLAQTVESASPGPADRLKLDLSSINTALSPSEAVASTEATMSPTRGVSEYAAEARRERKVLDLEISNSSLLAINASLEREVRRQKAELKRFRRLSRAGRFSFAASDRSSRVSEGLSTLDEEATEDLGDEAVSDNMDFSSDEDSDSLDFTDDASSDTRSTRENDRLAKDEKRLQVDLARHKELLTQSQMMNQTIKRCMYATEEMIADGRKALEYHVRVSDVKLGGRILTGNEDEDVTEIEVLDDEVDTTNTTSNDDEVESARGLLQVWQGVGQHKVDGSEGGDRDSGIEVDKSYFPAHTDSMRVVNPTSDSGRPPGEAIT